MKKAYTYNSTFNGTVIPMFMPTKMEQPMTTKTQNNATQPQTELSVFDVKELYDLAYSYEANDDAKFKAVLAEAVKLDMEYRRQIETKSNPFNKSTAQDVSRNSQVA